VLKAGRSPRFLGKKEVFDAPVVGQLATALGGIRVDRGTGSAEPLKRAAEALDAVRRSRSCLKARSRAVKRSSTRIEGSLRSGASRSDDRRARHPGRVVGDEKVWPRSDKVPRVWNVLRPRTSRCASARPSKLTREDEDADIVRIMDAIMGMLPPEAREQRTPTAEEVRLAKTDTISVLGLAELPTHRCVHAQPRRRNVRGVPRQSHHERRAHRLRSAPAAHST